MTKESFLKKTIECLERDHKERMRIAKNVAASISDDVLLKYDDNFFAPHCFVDALNSLTTDSVNSKHYPLRYVREHKKTVRVFVYLAVQYGHTETQS